ncbi:anhydro-N-acetylmuramic acid kinase [Candidatus Neomarinimicrobiota bacterium]
MTGTSMDGVDACLAKIRLSADDLEYQILDTDTVPFDNSLRDTIVDALTGSPDHVGALHFRLGKHFAKVTKEFLDGRAVDLIGCHGQTVAHRDGEYSLQIGTSAYLSQVVHVPVISNFREADIAAGGTGAPLMPFLDWMLCRSKPNANVLLNIGGVANITAVQSRMDRLDVIGFDTGPGMGLIDEAVNLLFDAKADMDARYSVKGRVDGELLDEMMSHPFITQEPPKSTGRDVFGRNLVKQLLEKHSIEPVDFLRTCVRFTVSSIADNLRRFVDFFKEVDSLIISGGGAHHPLLMADFKEELSGWNVDTSQAIGIDPDFKEALLIAVLAAARVQNIPGNMPRVTGARDMVVLGQVT